MVLFASRTLLLFLIINIISFDFGWLAIINSRVGSPQAVIQTKMLDRAQKAEDLKADEETEVKHLLSKWAYV
jgi:hypothetical protein